MTINPINLNKLRKELKLFGLNPLEWSLRFSDDKKAKLLISHKKEKGLSFVGLLSGTPQQPEINEVSLLSV